MKHALAMISLSVALLVGRDAMAINPAPTSCPDNTQNVSLGTTLPATSAAIRRGDELVVVAIGSSSTSGVGASDRAHAYPARLESELVRR